MGQPSPFEALALIVGQREGRRIGRADLGEPLASCKRTVCGFLLGFDRIDAFDPSSAGHGVFSTPLMPVGSLSEETIDCILESHWYTYLTRTVIFSEADMVRVPASWGVTSKSNHESVPTAGAHGQRPI